MTRQATCCPELSDPAGVLALADRLTRHARPARSLDDALSLVDPLAEVARRWLDESDPIRGEALARLPDASPFPPAMWPDALAAIFQPITADVLRAFVRDELGEGTPRVPRLIGHVLAGNVPAPAVQAIFCGLLTGAALLVKPADEDRLFPVLLARSIASACPAMGDRLGVAYWPGQSAACNRALASAAGLIVAFGQAGSIDAWRQLVSGSKAALVAHGPRTSIELIELPSDRAGWPELAERIAFDIAMYDQQGCLSPQQVYLAGEGAARVESSIAFARVLGGALSGRASAWPAGRRELGTRLAIRRAREAHRIRRLADPAGGPWLPDDAVGPATRFDWTLLSTAAVSPQIGPAGRTAFLTRVESLAGGLEAIRPLARAAAVQGAALHAAQFDRWAAVLGEELAIPYVCRPGELQRPPFGWRNDNIRPLRSLAGL